jgi:hypothetical protein
MTVDGHSRPCQLQKASSPNHRVLRLLLLQFTQICPALQLRGRYHRDKHFQENLDLGQQPTTKKKKLVKLWPRSHSPHKTDVMMLCGAIA